MGGGVSVSVLEANGRLMKLTFDRPPLNEVVLSLQSESVKGFTTPYSGLFWGRIRDCYPETQTQPPLDPVVERFEGAPACAGDALPRAEND